MTAEKVYFLGKADFLADLNTHDLTELATDFAWEEYAPGSYIMIQGQANNWFYVLAEGKAQALVTKEGHSHWQVNLFEPGDTFGEIAIFTGETAPTTIQCLEKCRVLALDSEHFMLMLLRWPRIYERFIEKLSHSLKKVNLSLWEAKHKEFLRSALQMNHYQDKFYGVWGSVKTTKEVERKINELTTCREPLLVIGERGTGRQMFAWHVHKKLFGEKAPFVVVDGSRFEQEWGNLFADQVSSENATHFKSGSLLDIAEGGTLFIREVNQIPLHTQAILAESMKNSTGSCLVIGCLRAEPEVVSQNLVPELLGLFPQNHQITPLRQRKRDIPFIAQGVLQKLASRNNLETPILNQESTKLLLSHSYRQGNVTELIQVIERAFHLADGGVINLEHIFFGPTAAKIGRSIDLLSWPWISNVLRKTAFLQRIRFSSLLVYLVILLMFLLIPQATSTTRVLALVWGLWWPALAILSPLLGRLWCTVCPFSFIMDLIQKKWHFNRTVPDWLKKYDYLLTTGLFLLVFWVEIVAQIRSNPTYTLFLLLAIQAAAVTIGIVFTRHTWCRHICPLGGFVGMASIGSLLEIRADSAVCLNKCTTHECYVGGELAGCPMSQHLPFLDNNLGCKFCFNCVRNCPNGAVNFNLRIPAREVWHLVRVDQGFTIFIGASLGVLIPINYFEPLQLQWPQGIWLFWFTLAYWGAAVASGLITWLIAKPYQTKAASLRTKLVFAFIPLVIAGHIIYQIHFVPGSNTVLLGLGIKDAATTLQMFVVPVSAVAQTLAALIGLALTAFAVSMVFMYRRHTTNHKNG
ncbi:cyclic nucleotide-binding domain-containing protein [Desulfosporosinus sp. OT]|uniref:cyclic nucleotide-binding domain-containing protein n=1 Tax=Desulfosporosinus sp. OT TaxID=913865 RepID=UPI000223A048|nr:cyclic nucleotide-binding domain-containing protein [Desulfosporosinus sp. OT]EGW37266.1 cyclic nucleotide-binding domain protein [Desulfosporosinus sp. OT]